MPKRIATTELNHDNWDNEDSDEEESLQIGVPVAKEVDLGKRRIIVAKRRSVVGTNVNDSVNSDKRSGVFSSFAGFAKQSILNYSKQADSNDAFRNDTNKAQVVNNGNAQLPSDVDRIIFVDIDRGGSATRPASNDQKIVPNRSSCVGTTSEIAKFQCANTASYANTTDDLSGVNGYPSSTKSIEHRQFCKHLKALNEGVFKWIEKHIKANPYIDLSPIFADYAKHFKTLERRFNCDRTNQTKKQNGSIESAEPSPGFSLRSTPGKPQNTVEGNVSFMPNFGALASENVDAPQNSSKSYLLDLGSNKTSSTDSNVHNESKAPFSFGFPQLGREPKETDDRIGKTADFSFKLRCAENKDNEKPVGGLFSCLNNAEVSDINGNESDRNIDEDQHYEPPKPELVVIEEKDAFHSVKCKLFYKYENRYIEKGVGTMHLKRLENDRRQLLIRTDTALGNILLNVCLNDATPCTRTGKNNVSLICMPNPPLNPPKTSGANDDKFTSDDELKQSAQEQQCEPVSFLIRVKTTQDADQLFEHMKPKEK